MHHHRLGSGGLSSAPPPPMLSRSSRSTGASSGRMPIRSSRSRSRSRSPPSRSGRYREKDSRDARERERERERRRSVSPYGSSRDRNEKDRDRRPTSSSKISSADTLPSISLIQSDGPATSIIRRILNPEDVKIPRRVNEGSKPIFERDELKEAMRIRMTSNNNEENPPQPNAYIQDTPSLTQQRVVAIIREPLNAADIYPSFSSSKSSAPQPSTSQSSSRIHRITPDSPPTRLSSSVGYERRYPSPPKEVRRHASPPPVSSSLSHRRERSLDRERERDRLIMLERERERERLIAERDSIRSSGPPGVSRDRELRDLRTLEVGRPIALGGSREHRREDVRSDLDRGREREKSSRFGPPPPTQPHPLSRRSRSPISRVPREDIRLRRRSRSHSQTPPPMPDEIRRQIIERQRNIDLRSSLSRQPGKFGSDDRSKGRNQSGTTSVRGSGRGAGRGGGFSSRTGRGREDERRVWVHDMFEDDEPKKIN